jgi:DNA-directed RNA polymerase specialized sigma24 family protein
VKATTSAELIEEMAPQMARLVSYKLRAVPFIPRHDIEDITQEALLRACSARKPCDPKRSDAEIRSWFYKAAITAIDRYFLAKRRKKYIPRTCSIDYIGGVSTAERTPLEVHAGSDQRAMIMQEIRSMKPVLRDLLLCQLGEGDPPPGYTKHSRRTLLGRARAELRARLQCRGIIPSPASTAEA